MKEKIYRCKLSFWNAQIVLLITACFISTAVTVSHDAEHANYFDALPKIYAFYSIEDGKLAETWGDDWKLAWRNAGWNPIVLRLKDSGAEESIKLLSALLVPLKLTPWENFRFYRWAAMAHVASPTGGWMSEIDVFPLHIKPEEGTKLPNKGALSLHNGIEASLVSGNRGEFFRVMGYMVKILKQRAMDTHLNYDIVWETILQEHSRYIQVTDNVGQGYFSHDLDGMDCSKYSSNIKAVHFWASSSNEAFLGGRMETEIRKEIRVRYGKELNFRYKHRGNIRIYENEEERLYKTTHYNDANNVEVIIEGNSVGTLHDVLIGMHGSDAAVKFISDIIKKCPR